MPRLSTVRLLADALELVGPARDEFCASASPDPVNEIADRPGPGLAPAQLPADVSAFTGRDAELDELDGLLATPDTGTTAVVISAVAGTAGVGKTVLAVHWAHRIRYRFPDGQLYVNLRGFDPTGTVMAPAEAIRGWLDALGVPPQRIPTDLHAQAGLYRSLLADKRMLVVLDNARDADQVRLLLPGAPGCLVLITSRNQLTGLVATQNAHLLSLDLLTPDEARDLLTRRVGEKKVVAEPDAVGDIIIRCARLPLALAIVAARATTQPTLPLATLAAELGDLHDRLDALTTGEITTDVRAVFSWSYQALTPAAARLFRLLGLHPGPDISVPAAASLAGLPRSQVRPLLAELTRANMLIEHVPGRYTFHDLLRAYATQLAHTVDPDDQRRTAQHRVLDHYLHTAHTADRLLDPIRDPISLTHAQAGTTPEKPADHQQALAWFTAEHLVLLAAVDHAAVTGLDTHTWQLAWTFATFLQRRGHWHDDVVIQSAAVTAARRLADPAVLAVTHRSLARAYRQLKRYDDSRIHLRHALDLFQHLGDRLGQAHIHLNLGALSGQQDRHAEALHHDRQALNLFRAAGHPAGQAIALNGVGWYHALLGDHEQALVHCQQARILFQELGDGAGEAGAWDSLGYAHHHLGHHARAVTCYQHALNLIRDAGDRYYETETLTHLGDTHHATRNPAAAHQAWQQALNIFNDLNHPNADHVRAKLRHLDQT